MVETFMRQPLFDKLYSKRQAFISIACMRYVGDVLIKASRCESWVGPFWYMGLFFKHPPVMYVVYITFQAGRPSRVGPYAGPGRGVFYELRVARSDVVSLSLSRRYAASESAKKAVARGSWFVKAHHHSGRAPHVGALTKHGISGPIVGACTWQARYGYVNIMHADICVCFHALRVHHRFRQVGPYAPGRWPYFFCEPHSFLSPACDIVGDVLIKASRCESWV